MRPATIGFLDSCSYNSCAGIGLHFRRLWRRLPVIRVSYDGDTACRLIGRLLVSRSTAAKRAEPVCFLPCRECEGMSGSALPAPGEDFLKAQSCCSLLLALLAFLSAPIDESQGCVLLLSPATVFRFAASPGSQALSEFLGGPRSALITPDCRFPHHHERLTLRARLGRRSGFVAPYHYWACVRIVCGE